MKFPKLKGKAILSPMAGVTDVAFRALAKKYGAALTCTELLSSAALVRDNSKSKEMLKTDKIEKPVAVQLFGNNVEEVLKAASYVEDKFDIIDLNCGCPAWNVIRSGAGSALLKNPKLVGNLVRKLVDTVSVPITLKIRTGINANNLNFLEVAKIAQEAGASALAIHGRTQQQGYSGVADWEIIKKVKEELTIPVIGNGDVFTPEIFKKRLDSSGIDAIMIARGALGNPFIFKQINDYLEYGSYSSPNKISLFFEYLELAKEHKIGFPLIKNHALQFTKGLAESTSLRLEISQLKTLQELITYWNALE